MNEPTTNAYKLPETKLIFVGPERIVTDALFNANAFPEELKDEVDACSTRVSIVLLHVKNVKQEVLKDKERFLRELQRTDTYKTLCYTRNDINIVAYYDGLEYIAALHGFFYSIKSFFDVYAQLMIKLIDPKGKMRMTFSKATINSRKIVGGNIVNWLRNSAPNTFKKSAELSALIIHHSETWIFQTVKYRDELSHYCDIKGIKHMHTVLFHEEPLFKAEDIVFPVMPNGLQVANFCENIVDNLRTFIEQSLVLLPDVKLNFLYTGRWVLAD